MAQSDEPSGDDSSAPKGKETPAYAPTPLDGPYFVPVLLLAGALWFGYDGFLNPDRLDPAASLSKYLAFNQWGAGILAAAGLGLGLRAWLQQRNEDDEPSGRER
ncbi:MAG: hypothetical protein JRH01_11040 [Deltaproteobacteria bacterium]|nr:hypothetical protein [Deltaproteobacteria bacterium]MBW2394216.1 hypothetical protein [Deltaproteobacteria bacterium]